MPESVTYFISLIVLALGFFLGYAFRKRVGANSANSAEKKAEEIIEKAKEKHQDILLKSKEKAVYIIDEAKKEEQERRQELNHKQKRIEERESLFDKKLLNLENKQQDLIEKTERIEKLKEEIKKFKKCKWSAWKKLLKCLKKKPKMFSWKKPKILLKMN